MRTGSLAALLVVACGSATQPPPTQPTPTQPAPVAPSVVAEPAPETPAPAPSVPAASATTSISDSETRSLAEMAESLDMSLLGPSGTSPTTTATTTPDAAATKVVGPASETHIGGVTGANLPSNTNRIVASLRARFRACHQRGLNRDPAMAGKVVLQVKLAANGEVLDAIAQSKGIPPDVGQCMAAVAKRAQFEPGEEPATMVIAVTLAIKK